MNNDYMSPDMEDFEIEEVNNVSTISGFDNKGDGEAGQIYPL